MPRVVRLYLSIAVSVVCMAFFVGATVIGWMLTIFASFPGTTPMIVITTVVAFVQIFFLTDIRRDVKKLRIITQ